MWTPKQIELRRRLENAFSTIDELKAMCLAWLGFSLDRVVGEGTLTNRAHALVQYSVTKSVPGSLEAIVEAKEHYLTVLAAQSREPGVSFDENPR